MIMILYSYWIPQIWLNAKRGSARRVLSKEYVMGTTVARLYLPLYIWACPDNILFKETSRASVPLTRVSDLMLRLLAQAGCTR